MEKQTKTEKEVALSQIKQRQIVKQPILETQVVKSEDGRWIIHRTIITDIKPVTYFEKVLS